MGLLTDIQDTKPRNIYDFFPHDEYRMYQKETIRAIEKAYSDGYKYVLVEGPCGSGKSAIAITLGKYYDDAFLITSQKILQEQYMNDYSSIEVADIRGRNNYQCAFMPGDCNNGRCTIHDSCPDMDKCPYNQAKRRALCSQIALMNYTYFFYSVIKAGVFLPRDLLIYDEAHNIDKELMSFIEINFTSKYISSLSSIFEIPDYKNVGEYQEWLEEVAVNLNAIVGRNEDEIKERKESLIDMFLAESEEEEIKRLLLTNKRLSDQVDKIERFSNTCDDVEWIFHLQRGRYTTEDKITFKPITVSHFAREMLFPHADKHFFMSATILDKKNFCNNIGINPDEAKFLRIDSTFPAVNRPVYFTDCGAMRRDALEDTKPNIVAQVENVLSQFPKEKGMVYTHTYDISNIFKRILTINSKRG